MSNRHERSAPRNVRRRTIGLAAGMDVASVVADAIAALPPSDRTWPTHAEVVVVAPRAWNDAAARAVLGRVKSIAEAGANRRPRLWRTPGGVGQAAATLRERWIESELGPGSERFDRARTPRALQEATRLFVAPAGGGRLPSASPVAIAAAFAHPRQRWAVQAEGDAGALAELAAPLAPRLAVAVARAGDRWLAAAAADLVAAELAWLGLAEMASERGDVVPWQNPAVQRLCLLGPFARGPDEIAIADAASVDAATLHAFAASLGIPDEVETRRDK